MSPELHWYAESDQAEPLRAAITAGADLAARDEEGRTALHVAVANGRLHAIRILLEAGADPEAIETATPGYRALHRACLPTVGDGSLEPDRIDLLLRHDATPDAADERGTTPLHLCVAWCEAELVERLVGHGARAGARDRSGITPLHVAVRRGTASAADDLLESHGEIPSTVWSHRKESALSRLDDVAVVEVLLAEGADPNAADRHGVTPLHVAASRGTAWAVRRLLDAGASPALSDEWECTALHRVSDVEVAGQLLDAGAPVDACDRDGATPLHRAVGAGRGELVDLLIDGGAPLEVADGEGRTPLHLAATAGRGLAVDRLLDEGVAPAPRDADGRTPLDLAKAGRHTHVIAALERRGGRGGGGGGRRRFPFFGGS